LDDIEDRLGIGGSDVYQADRRFTGKLEKKKKVLIKFNKISEGNLSRMKP